VKKIIFLCGIPRAGNTLFSSIINQNKNIKVTANSILPEILYYLCGLKNKDVFQNFPDHQSLNNVIETIIGSYYKDWEAEVIIDRAPWGTPDNLNIIKQLIKKPKFIILIRPVIECIASFAKLQIDNGIYTKENIHLYVEELMSTEGITGKNIWSIKNLIKEKEDYKIFSYDDLVNNTDRFLKDLSAFIGFKIKHYNELKQFNVNDVYYQDGIENLHKIRIDQIKRQKYDIRDYLPEDIIEKYSDYEII
jgi:hypothetical protein